MLNERQKIWLRRWLYAHYAIEFETASSSASVSGSGSCVTCDVASRSMSSANDTHDPWKSAVEEF